MPRTEEGRSLLPSSHRLHYDRTENKYRQLSRPFQSKSCPTIEMWITYQQFLVHISEFITSSVYLLFQLLLETIRVV